MGAAIASCCVFWLSRSCDLFLVPVLGGSIGHGCFYQLVIHLDNHNEENQGLDYINVLAVGGVCGSTCGRAKIADFSKS